MGLVPGFGPSGIESRSSSCSRVGRLRAGFAAGDLVIWGHHIPHRGPTSEGTLFAAAGAILFAPKSRYATSAAGPACAVAHCNNDAIVEVSPIGFTEPGESESDKLAHRLWVLRRSEIRARYERLGVAVASWSDDAPLDAVLEGVRAFRRHAQIARV